ncbi:MAG: capsular polysaccharide biosynthesis protein [Clostridiales bacterium]|nr:capsular polysaccharide biosynthesis protein [Clostridiales bacterium]
MIDFHSHIIPCVDDGSSSVEESVQMLRLSYQDGVRKIVATPHFYAQEDTPDRFLARRDAAWERLAPRLSEDMPEIYLGAEVYYYDGISNTECLSQLCVGQSSLLLLEMPFRKWSERMIAEAIDIVRGRGFTVLLAHVDRYFTFQDPDVWDLLSENGVLFQVNAVAFLDGWLSRRRALRLLREGKIAALGSDCHNMTSRKPNLGRAYAEIEKRAGQDVLRQIDEKSGRLLAGIYSTANV